MRLICIFVLSVFRISCNEKSTLTENNTTQYYNSDIVNKVGDSPKYVDALVARDGVILYACKSDFAKEIAGEGRKKKVLRGKTMLPGFIDGHAHVANFGIQAVGALLLPALDADAKDIPTILQIINDWNTKEYKDGSWFWF